MTKTIKFLHEGLQKLEHHVGMTGKEVKMKRGNLVVTWENAVFTMKHFNTTILVLDFSNKHNLHKCVREWHMQSATDANYVRYAMQYWGMLAPNVDIGYGSVNGARFRFKDAEGNWEDIKDGEEN